ncbi:MAG TPA: bifunctional folylpolyglutamate synthase/dihydrofolate synthase [Clostridiales bacterium]|nr:bifunctional folylpolyglutamate synthase/dihydrofolate synthase [Clostridiales bacterium]
MTYKQALKKINSLLLFGSRPGLDRIKKLLKLLGNPQDKLKYIHIAGTNGKGSTCTMLSSILTNAGYKTGLFISPFVIDFRERMQMNGEMIPEQDLADCVSEIFPVVERMRDNGEIITEFELVTAIAFYWFAQQGCDIVVLETGLGGRFDSTNVIRTPLVSVITSISLDHTAILGDTVEEIAMEKCGIIKDYGYTVFYPQESNVNNVILNFSNLRCNTFVNANEVQLTALGGNITHTDVEYRGFPMKLNLIGKHQIKNLKTVLAVIEVLQNHRRFYITDENIADGLAKATMPARLELLSTEPVVLVDGAHNPNGMEALSQAITDYLPNKNIVCIMGMLRDKDSNSSLEYLDGLFDAVITLEPDNPRKQTSEELAEKAVKFFDKVYPMESFSGAVDKALEMAGDDGAVVVCGSLYLASQLRPILIRKLKQRKEI